MVEKVLTTDFTCGLLFGSMFSIAVLFITGINSLKRDSHGCFANIICAEGWYVVIITMILLILKR